MRALSAILASLFTPLRRIKLVLWLYCAQLLFALLIAGPWMLAQLHDFTVNLFTAIPSMLG